MRSLSLVVASSLVLGGCAVVASPVGNAAIYTSVRGPIATGSAPSSSKEGRACASNVIGIVATGDASIAAAKRAGGISSVASVDHDSLNVLGFYSRFCTLVAGE
jgi:hypothetical protein